MQTLHSILDKCNDGDGNPQYITTGTTTGGPNAPAGLAVVDELAPSVSVAYKIVIGEISTDASTGIVFTEV